jgi:hypothetical protein
VGQCLDHGEWAVATRHQTGGARRRRSGPSGLQMLAGPFRKWKMKTKMELGSAARGTFGSNSNRAAKKN